MDPELESRLTPAGKMMAAGLESGISLTKELSKAATLGCLGVSCIALGAGIGIGSFMSSRSSEIPVDPTPIVSTVSPESTSVVQSSSSIDSLATDWNSVIGGSSYGYLIADESKSFHDTYAKYILPMITFRDGSVSAIDVNKANALLREFNYTADAGDISMYSALFENGAPSSLASRMDKRLLKQLGFLVMNELSDVEAREVNDLWSQAAHPDGFRSTNVIQKPDAAGYYHDVTIFLDGPFSDTERASMLSDRLDKLHRKYASCRGEAFRLTHQ